jgi:hypothetical protein
MVNVRNKVFPRLEFPPLSHHKVAVARFIDSSPQSRVLGDSAHILFIFIYFLLLSLSG